MSKPVSNTLIATGAIVTAGQFANGKGMTIRIVVGGSVLAIGITMIESYNEYFAKMLALMVLVAAIYAYLPSIAKRLNLNGNVSSNSGTVSA